MCIFTILPIDLATNLSYLLAMYVLGQLGVKSQNILPQIFLIKF
jgi:hypothetical protein